MKSTIGEFAAERDLTLQQIFVLYHLYTEDHILMGALAGRLHCDASNITGLIDRLQAAGLIDRRVVPEDRRAKQLTITGKGRALIEELIPRLPDGLDFGCLNTDDIHSLHHLLQKLGKPVVPA